MSRADKIGKTETKVFTLADGTLCVRYHKTVVWERSPDGRVVTLRTGGWYSRTTARRMNQAFRQFGGSERFHYICQRKGAFMLGHYAGNGVHAPLVEFTDGMQVAI